MKFENADGTIKFEIRGVAHYQKWLSQHDAKIRKQTIDEFRNECESASYIPLGYGYYVVDMRDVRKIADLMKEHMKGETV